ncbi:MAG: hypothetical protein NC936_04410 [Candidatus Omnitrophica bacterium]|nr:hypothetical protein [Candidatus Omnitrophota bacterium]MCM8771091.1 hypothetical protein [Candidatus Omnitrophota bacterium]
MSIIYDALKKIEKKEEKRPQGFRKRKNISFGVLIFLCIAIALTIFFIQRAKRQLLRAKEMQNSIQVKTFSTPSEKAFPPETASTHQESYTLEGIIYSYDNPLAIINGKIVKKDDLIDNFKVVAIKPESVELLNSDDNTSLTLSLN